MRILVLLGLLVGCGAYRADTGNDAGGDDVSGDDVGDDDPGTDVDAGEPEQIVPCEGVNVPGDYPDLQMALDALAHAGEDAAICLGAGTFDLPLGADPTHIFSANDVEEHGKALRISGLSRTETILVRPLMSQAGWASLVVENMTFETGDLDDGISLYNVGAPAQFEVRNVKMSGALHITSFVWDDVDSVIDRCEIGTGSRAPIESMYIVANSYSERVRVTNSVLHGVVEALHAENPVSQLDLTLINNTFVGASHVLLENDVTATIANNIFTGATGTSLSWGPTAVVTSSTNADCPVDATMTPAIGSFCINAADPTLAPDHDYANHARGAQPDIGAIER